ncbi:Mitotic checkpoint regulator, MAD2B-interacting domain containing protein [Amanita muscaria]
MLGIEDYGSGSESEEGKPIKTSASATSKSSISTQPREKRALDATSVSKTKRPKKITIGLPSLRNADVDAHDEPPPPKKARTAGAGASSLLSMLPAPKQANPAPQRVLGGKAGPGLVFTSAIVSQEEVDDRSTPLFQDKPAESSSSSTTFLPPSLAKGKANVSLEDRPRPTFVPTISSQRTVDPFSLGTISRASGSSAPPTSSSTAKVSSAPEVPTFVPPEPIPTDPYPGYYQLPSGAWEAYDATYYASFLKKWKNEYDAHVRALEKGTAKGFEGYDDGSLQEVDTQKEMERAKVELKEREERKALTKGTGAGSSAPNMKVTASKMSGIAKSRHQLATLLREAYQNRDALEDRIAEGRRNRKEAGNKYGF